MNSAEYVGNLINQLKEQGNVLSDVAWQAALACVGWAYVFGARGQYCTPENRRAKYRDDHQTIRTSCKNFNGSSSAGCSGCKWYPGCKYTRIFDCRGFTYWILKQVYDGWELMGAGATAQWNTESNWKAKGTIDTMPKDTLCCLFVKNGSKMEHTGFGLNNETIECSAGVQHFTSRNKKWTHWAVPVVIDGEIPTPTPDPDYRPTLRKGDSGTYVTLMQTMLIQRGYSCGASGADGKFGNGTLAALRVFQRDNGLTVDGVCGPKTWAALQSTEPTKRYTVTVTGLTLAQAEGLVNTYDNATMREE